jgi:hypothetical protein
MSDVGSPNLSEFERFLEGCENETTTITKKKNTRSNNAKNKLDSDDEDDLETFENVVVRARSKRQTVACIVSPNS